MPAISVEIIAGVIAVLGNEERFGVQRGDCLAHVAGDVMADIDGAHSTRGVGRIHPPAIDVERRLDPMGHH